MPQATKMRKKSRGENFSFWSAAVHEDFLRLEDRRQKAVLEYGEKSVVSYPHPVRE